MSATDIRDKERMKEAKGDVPSTNVTRQAEVLRQIGRPMHISTETLKNIDIYTQ